MKSTWIASVPGAEMGRSGAGRSSLSNSDHVETSLGLVVITEVDGVSSVGRYMGTTPAKVGDRVPSQGGTHGLWDRFARG